MTFHSGSYSHNPSQSEYSLDSSNGNIRTKHGDKIYISTTKLSTRRPDPVAANCALQPCRWKVGHFKLTFGWPML